MASNCRVSLSLSGYYVGLAIVHAYPHPIYRLSIFAYRASHCGTFVRDFVLVRLYAGIGGTKLAPYYLLGHHTLRGSLSIDAAGGISVD